MLAQAELSDKDKCFVLSQLAVYGLDNFADYYEQWFDRFTHSGIKHFAQKKQQEWLAVQAIPQLRAVLTDKTLTRQLLDLSTPYFERGSVQPEKLLIVFTTMYNNFYLSNPVFLAFIRALGVSVLILKDNSVYNYLNGIPGFGDSFDEAASALTTLIKKEQIEKTYITGFSSGGYASLLMSTRIACDGYLGFSIGSDVSANSQLPVSKFFTPDVVKDIDDNVKLDLAAVFKAKPYPYKCKIIYGAHTNIDAPHAENLNGIDGFEVCKLADAGHITLAPLLIRNELLAQFEVLIT